MKPMTFFFWSITLHRHHEVTGSNPIEVLTFSGLYMQLLKSAHNCDDHSLLDNKLLLVTVVHTCIHIINKVIDLSIIFLF